MRFIMLMLCALCSNCSHPGSLISTEKNAWINVGGSVDRLYYCVADDPTKPVCYGPQLLIPAGGAKYNPRFE